MNVPRHSRFDEDDDEDLPHRRSGERRLQSIADSPLLKVITYMITGIIVPVMGAMILAGYGELRDLNIQINKISSDYSLMNYRLTQIEALRATREAQITSIQGKLNDHELRLGITERDQKGQK